MKIKTVMSGVFLALAVAMMTSSLQGQPDRTVYTKHELARIKFGELQERMQKLQIKLKESQPEESRVLEVGNQYAQEVGIKQDMQGIRKLLREERWDEALEKMGEVRKELGYLRDLLLNRDMDLKKLLEEIARLEAYKERVEKLIDREQEHKEAAARAAALQEQAERVAQAKAKTDELIKSQKELQAQANAAGLQAAPTDAGQMTDQQGELKEQAENLADDVKALEEKNEDLEATDPSTPPAEAGKPPSKPNSPSKPSPSKPSPGSKPGSNSCNSAAESMGKSQKKLGQNKPESSLEDMAKALEMLKKAKADLQAMEEDLQRQLQEIPFELQAREQEQTKVDTDTLSKDMEASDDEKDGEDKQPTPGTQNVQQSVPKMKAASGMLKERRAKRAKQEQQDAKEDLENAKRALEDALAQLRQQLQDEVLRSLEERFGAMLAKQKEISARTKVADRLRGQALTSDGGMPAALQERCRQLSGKEMELASEAGDALKLLEEEGTTAVFPVMVGELKEELESVADRLAAYKTGETTQARQQEIVDMLSLLINALRRAIEDGEGGQCSSCNGVPQLVPLSAELKLVQALQKRVHKRTKQYDQERSEQDTATEEAHAEAAKISVKQGRVEELTRKLADKVNKLDGAGGR